LTHFQREKIHNFVFFKKNPEMCGLTPLIGLVFCRGELEITAVFSANSYLLWRYGWNDFYVQNGEVSITNLCE